MSFTVREGDALAVLRTLPANSFDGCLTDPPYGLSFMGKAWDHGVPDAEVWREVLRVLKPGAPLLAFGGTRTFHRLACAIEDAGFILTDTLCWLHGQGFPKGYAQLKPAWEPITLAWKKGKRALAIDAARIGTTKRVPGSVSHTDSAYCYGKFGQETGTESGHDPNIGRWPANVLLDEEAAAQLDKMSGISDSVNRVGLRSGRGANGLQFGMAEQGSVSIGHDDAGGASRFFYTAKASPSERSANLQGRNQHPTVKPVDLNRYLASLILPPERDTPRSLLVPFCGSGSEILGAIAAGWESILGIEISEEYCKLARERIEESAPLFLRQAVAL